MERFRLDQIVQEAFASFGIEEVTPYAAKFAKTMINSLRHRDRATLRWHFDVIVASMLAAREMTSIE